MSVALDLGVGEARIAVAARYAGQDGAQPRGALAFPVLG